MGGGGGGWRRLFTSLAEEVGAYSGMAFIKAWVLIRGNMVMHYEGPGEWYGVAGKYQAINNDQP